MKKFFPLFLKLIAAIMMLQTLYFKFSGAQESIDLFTIIAGENEALMRIGTGVLELIASILLFIPRRLVLFRHFLFLTRKSLLCKRSFSSNCSLGNLQAKVGSGCQDQVGLIASEAFFIEKTSEHCAGLESKHFADLDVSPSVTDNPIVTL